VTETRFMLQIEVLNDEVGAMVAQFDFMQQRVQSQDVIGGAVQRMQRRCTRYLQVLKGHSRLFRIDILGLGPFLCPRR
jgi:hypothetical protein